MNVSYVRLFADDQGESHFADIDMNLNQVNFAPNIPPLFTSEAFSAIETTFFSAPSGWKSVWHPSSGRNLFAVLSGTWEVTASDGETRTFSTGDVLLVEDTSGKGHTSRALGDVDSVALLVTLTNNQTPA